MHICTLRYTTGPHCCFAGFGTRTWWRCILKLLVQAFSPIRRHIANAWWYTNNTCTNSKSPRARCKICPNSCSQKIKEMGVISASSGWILMIAVEQKPFRVEVFSERFAANPVPILFTAVNVSIARAFIHSYHPITRKCYRNHIAIKFSNEWTGYGNWLHSYLVQMLRILLRRVQ